MFRNLAYDVTALMKAAQGLKDEHALKWGQWQVTTKVASAGNLVALSPELEVSAEPLSEAKSQIRAFMKVIPWISEFKAWNAKCKLARANNIHAVAGIGTHAQGGSRNCNNGQG